MTPRSKQTYTGVKYLKLSLKISEGTRAVHHHICSVLFVVKALRQEKEIKDVRIVDSIVVFIRILRFVNTDFFPLKPHNCLEKSAKLYSMVYAHGGLGTFV